MIKTIIFDAFGTLFKVTGGASAKRIITHIENTGVFVDESAFLEEWKSFYKKKTAHGVPFMTERKIFIERIGMFYNRYGVFRNPEADADELLAEAFLREAYEDTIYALENLKKNFSVFIGSNTDNDVLTSVMEKNNVFLDNVYTSENLRCYKPSPNFYKKIINENNLFPDEVLFVGDSLSDDIWGPRKIGIKTCWVNRNTKDTKDTKPDYTVNTLLEIEQCLKTYR